MSTAGLGRRAARGAAVTLTGQAIRIAVQVLSVTVLARLLSPQDYGLLAMVAVIVGVGEIFRDFGLSSAAVQAKELSTAQRNNLFWINTGIGLVLATLVAGGAGLIAAVYSRSELVGIARALAVTFLLNGMATQYRASLLRGMKFARVAVAEVAAPTVALAVATAWALTTGSYWALVAQNLTQSTVLLVGMVIGGRWLPGRPRRGVPMRALLSFGWRLVGTQLVGYASNNTDTLVIGLRFGAGPLGLYNRGFQLLMRPLSQLRAPTTTVALPVLSRLHAEPERYADFVRRGQLALGYTLVAALALVAATADPVTAVFLGGTWSAVAPVLRLLAIAGIFQTLSYVGYWVYLSRDLTTDLFRYTLVSAAIKITCVLVGSLGGIVGVAAGYAVAPALAWPLSLWWLNRRTSIPARDLATGALRILAVAGAAALSAAAVSAELVSSPAMARIAAAGAVGMAVYGLAALAVPAVRRDLAGVAEAIRMARSRGR
ncbi:lipopolysaccharide biosynthesis protein [Isoptericola sp. b490]|uniref:lipopolysaccharide biosynthesis protein n=1 Tax=Actinotalea lenta TaxID=3064654 RepID=UPI0027128E2A|nr:lipopolysaccharide biosynthesis protein [Isoptericola sp. b490]MDO8121487.1 lipopolysaccharide biosynthesis protein [Isoptericola sp. b490]